MTKRTDQNTPAGGGPEKPPLYEVGYKRPPPEHRFKKGQSGNPAGRRKRSRNVRTLLAAALDETVIVVERGRRRKRTMREVIVTQLVKRSANADLRAIEMLLRLIGSLNKGGKSPPEEEPSAEEGEAAFRHFAAILDDYARLKAATARPHGDLSFLQRNAPHAPARGH